MESYRRTTNPCSVRTLLKMERAYSAGMITGRHYGKTDDSIQKQPPGRLIAAGFAMLILFGAVLLLLPLSVRGDAEVHFIDALFTSTSAVCVTGLIAIDVADHFTTFGQAVVAVLIQVGGLGVTSIGVGLILAARKNVGLKGRILLKEALNIQESKA